ncbi:MAG: hypothetical protein KDB00_01995 [Planctomycetales bacterium]|nr:hypothetical protein [Planctomycetales bacterium]
MIIDAQRFGLFHYSSYEEVNDFRIGRYLPPTARQIELQKYASGHRAMYSISKQELTTYLDGLWKTHGDRSASSRDELDDGELVSIESYRYEFDGLGWQLPERAVKFYSPIQSDGGGADYYFDPEAEMTYHRAGYW